MRKVFERILSWFRKPKRSYDVSITAGGSVTHVVLTDGDNFWPLPPVANDQPSPTIPPFVIEVADEIPYEQLKEEVIRKLNEEKRVDEETIVKLIHEHYDDGCVIISYSNTQALEKLVEFVKSFHPTMVVSVSSCLFVWVVIISWSGTKTMFSVGDIIAHLNDDGSIRIKKPT